LKDVHILYGTDSAEAGDVGVITADRIMKIRNLAKTSPAYFQHLLEQEQNLAKTITHFGPANQHPVADQMAARPEDIGASPNALEGEDI
jgi:hypothetical protein